jgi:hypothetical protein
MHHIRPFAIQERSHCPGHVARIHGPFHLHPSDPIPLGSHLAPLGVLSSTRGVTGCKDLYRKPRTSESLGESLGVGFDPVGRPGRKPMNK